MPGRRDSGQPAPVTVRLTVDRVEVRLPAPAPARRESSREGRERRDSRPGRRPELSLDEYVRHREDRRP
ncbi:hypothetical protein C1I93_10030 [Micromonospora endophytica]|uniref:Uncharacterized protein n=1 Tax=Micromonospora endophytica TaxID=515350 RepID=A0A2W2CF30_9ACTN|nr:hypothetical protein C1I93_10030 [Micromonospora endophytica]